MSRIKVGSHSISKTDPVFVVAEIGINHNGSLEIAKRLIDAAKNAGCDAVKFQKRTPKLCVPEAQMAKMRETPWGTVSYIEYREKMEFGLGEYKEIDAYCKKLGIVWFASCWDEPSVDFIEQFAPPCYKIPSAMLTNIELLAYIRELKRPMILSTGMSTMGQIRAAVTSIGTRNLVMAHSTSTYPCPEDELNLKMIATLRNKFDCPIGYSGHEVGTPTTVAAVALGACYVERHITLDRAMWGTDQAVSIEPREFTRLVKYIRVVETALGDGVKKVYASEIPNIKKLRQN